MHTRACHRPSLGRISMDAMGGGGGAHMSMSAMVALSSDASRAASDRSMASDSSVGSMIVRPIAGSPPAESQSQQESSGQSLCADATLA